MSVPTRMGIRPTSNPSNNDKSSDNDASQSRSKDGAVPQSSEAKPTSCASPAHQPQGLPIASLPGQTKTKGKRQASNCPLADSSSPGLRRKRTKPNLKISPAAANSPFSPSNPSTAGTPLKTSVNAPAPENKPFGLGIEGFSTDAKSTVLPPSTHQTNRASPAKERGALTSLASSFGQLFNDAEDGAEEEHAKGSDDNETESTKKKGNQAKVDEQGDTEMQGTEDGPYDAIMDFLENAESEDEPDGPDLDGISAPPSPVIPAQQALSIAKGKQKQQQQQQQRMVFSMGEAIMSQNDILLNVCNYMGLREFVGFYCVSKRFYVLVNSHYLTHMRQLARNFAPRASAIFPYQLYKRACIRDPMARARPAHPGDHPTTYINPVLSDAAAATLSATAAPIPPAPGTAAEVVRTVPGLRWVQMCAYREALVHDMLLSLALEGHRFPLHVDRAVLKIWALLDHPFNGTRAALVHDRARWTNRDLFLALMFCVKLDMRFADPVLGAGECVLRRLFLGQRSLVVLWEALRGLAARSRAEVLHLLVRWDTTLAPEVVERLERERRERGGRRGGMVFGVPVEQVGVLCREGWRQGMPLLLRPDQLILRETMRRGLNMHRCFLDFMLWGHIDWTWCKNIDLPDLEALDEQDRKRREGVPTAGPSDGDGQRKISSGSYSEMKKATLVSD